MLPGLPYLQNMENRKAEEFSPGWKFIWQGKVRINDVFAMLVISDRLSVISYQKTVDCWLLTVDQT
jgi:hypothetical protein